MNVEQLLSEMTDTGIEDNTLEAVLNSLFTGYIDVRKLVLLTDKKVEGKSDPAINDTRVKYEVLIFKATIKKLEEISEERLNRFGGTVMEIEIRYHADIDKIEKNEVGDWIDLRAAEDVELKAGEFKLISLGVAIKLPYGYEAYIVPRSSIFKHWGILQTNHMGVIDNSYCGDNDIWKFPALATRDVLIEKNSRICQFRIVQKMCDVGFKTVDKLSGSNRGGFGSTGKV